MTDSTQAATNDLIDDSSSLSGVQGRPDEIRPQATPLVRALIDGSRGTVLALDANGVILTVNGLFEALVGRPRSALCGEAFVDALVPRASQAAARAELASALDRGTGGLELQVEAAGSGRLVLGLELARHSVGSESFTTATVTRASMLAPVQDGSAFRSRSYRVELTARGPRLIRGEDENVYRATVRPERCYEALHRRTAPCEGCPAAAALRGESDTVGLVRDEDANDYHLVRATLEAPDRARIEAVTLDRGAMAELVRGRIEAIAKDAGLSRREKDVLDHLLLGRTAEDVSTALGVSRHTVKFHQANILQKLGAESRFDLLRVLL